MLLESVFVGNQAVGNFCEGIQYSPPKDAVDSTTFNSYFVEGSFPMTEPHPLSIQKEPTQQAPFPLEDEYLSESLQSEADNAGDLADAEKYSVTGSLITCAQTADNWSTSPGSTYENSPLSKRASKTERKKNWMQLELSNADGSRSRTNSHHDEKEIFINTLFSADFANERVTKIALKMIDRTGLISQHEWEHMTASDQVVLKYYVENVYGLYLTPNDSLELLNQLNGLISVDPKGKRNEEKLKKTVKKVNTLITKAFVSINHLHHLDEFQLSEILFSAYFGPQSEAGLVNIFANSLAFSQKAFSRIVENQRYAEDFEAILRSTYMADFVKCRQDKVFKSIALIRKKLENGGDSDSTSLNDLIKRMPWQISEIADGAKLCLSIIEKIRSPGCA